MHLCPSVSYSCGPDTVRQGHLCLWSKGARQLQWCPELGLPFLNSQQLNLRCIFKKSRPKLSHVLAMSTRHTQGPLRIRKFSWKKCLQLIACSQISKGFSWLMWEGPSHCRWCRPGLVILCDIRKRVEQANKPHSSMALWLSPHYKLRWSEPYPS